MKSGEKATATTTNKGLGEAAEVCKEGTGARRLEVVVVNAHYRRSPHYITFSAFDPAEDDSGAAEAKLEHAVEQDQSQYLHRAVSWQRAQLFDSASGG